MKRIEKECKDWVSDLRNDHEEDEGFDVDECIADLAQSFISSEPEAVEFLKRKFRPTSKYFYQEFITDTMAAYCE